MSFARVKALGWAFGEVLTSAQMTQLDIDHALAVDAGGLQITARTGIVMRVEHPGIPLDPAKWELLTSGIWRTTDTSGSPIIIPFRVPTGSVITAVSTRILPTAGHGALPAGPPAMNLFTLDATATATSQGNVTDGSTSVGVYEAAHPLDITGLALTVDNVNLRYFLYLQPEFGANAINHTRLVWGSVTMNVASLVPG